LCIQAMQHKHKNNTLRMLTRSSGMFDAKDTAHTMVVLPAGSPRSHIMSPPYVAD